MQRTKTILKNGIRRHRDKDDKIRKNKALQREGMPHKYFCVFEESGNMQVRVVWSLQYTRILKSFCKVLSPKVLKINLSWDNKEGPFVI